ncbi:zinc finger protein ZAT9-like [Gastrolobium bilobum]|uniref:zinc finger protein ZAT9-like n=1 Tax=Gastrolobium bilobum TaxID=150636 RepID=UPI002AAF8323|nr:zinc finger protein ZAT9-like [Gastrolobium bilobum]
MALIVDQQSTFKHFCKICKKGFGCGRALGGHMRAHGIGDETGHMDDDDPASDWEERLGGGNVPPSNKRMYALRTNPNRLKSCRVCENCGKEFLSWKSFLEHGKCTSEDAAESPVSSPGSDAADDIIDDDGIRRGCGGWSKRKRSLRTKVGSFNYNCPSSEEEDLANCLMMLSNAIVDPLVAEPEESCASASKDEDRRNPMNNFIPPLSCRVPIDNNNNNNKAKGVAKGLFECKACKKVFNSHQALGGHRASHKKVKGCFAARLDNNLDDSLATTEDDVITHEEFFPTKSNSTQLQFDHHHHGSNNNPTLASSSKKKSKVHECSICHRSFSSGQALGGHKRCHWITSNAPETSTLARFQQFQDHMDQIPKFDSSSEPLDLKLDLNLPAPTNDLARRNVSTEIYLQPWVATTKDVVVKDDNSSQCQSHQHHNQVDNDNDEDKNNNNNNNNNSYNASLMQNGDNEADSKIKLAKLSELKDINIGGSSSPWLQVGIGSTTTDVGTDHC